MKMQSRVLIASQHVALFLWLLLVSLAAAAAPKALGIPAGRLLFSQTATGWSVTPEYVIRVNEYEGSLQATDVVLMVHGLGDTSKLYEPLAERLASTRRARKIFTVDLPAHGGSTTSTHAAFGPRVMGEIDMLEYVAVLEQVLTALQLEGRQIRTLVGHSLGGLTIQALQARLRANGDSLRTRFGIEKTILISSDLPDEVPWASQPFAQGLVTNLMVQSAQPGIGRIVSTPYQTFLQLKFADLNGVVAPGAPTLLAAKSINSAEPFAAAANIVGLNPQGPPFAAAPRMSIPAGLWQGEELVVAWLSQDPFFSRQEMEQLAQHLSPGTLPVIVQDTHAVHGAPYSKPAILLPLFDDLQ